MQETPTQPRTEPTLDKFLATFKAMAPRLPCCDHCESAVEIDAHLERLHQAYRIDIAPPSDYMVLPFGSFFSGEHMVYSEVAKAWIHFKGTTTMTPFYAKPNGPYTSYATKSN